MPKAPITGAAGYIGSLLVEDLANRGYNVYAVDNFLYDHGILTNRLWRHKNVRLFRQDITAIDNWGDFTKGMDYIVPLAAIVGAPACDKIPTYAKAVNLTAIEQMVKSLSEDQVVIYPNTNSGLGQVEGVADESTPRNAISLYGRLKDEAEDVVLQHKKSIVFRLATVFGSSYRTRLDLLVNTLVYEAYFNRRLELFDGHYRRNYISVKDVVRCFSSVITGELYSPAMFGQAYNLGLDEANMTKEELVKQVQSQISCEVAKSDKTDIDKRDYLCSSEKIAKIGFVASNTLQNGIEEMIQFCSLLPKESKQRTNLVRLLRNVE